MKMPQIERRVAMWIAHWVLTVTSTILLWGLVAFIIGVLMITGCAQTLPYCEGDSCEQGGAGGAGGAE